MSIPAGPVNNTCMEKERKSTMKPHTQASQIASPIPTPYRLPPFPRSISNGLASGVGFEIDSFRVLPLPFIIRLKLLPLPFLECGVFAPLALRGAAFSAWWLRCMEKELRLRLVFLLCVDDPGLVVGEGWALAIGRALLK